MSSTLDRTMSLREDAEDITNSLNDFFAERQAAIDLQNEAWHNYDQELLEIGEVQDGEDENGSVDHNMLRHIGGGKRGGSPGDRTSHSPDHNPKTDGGQSVMTESSGGTSLFYKKCSLSKKQRNDLRSAMLGFLESTRDEETALEEQFESALEEGKPFPHAEFMQLNDIHHKNYDILMQYLSDYQPQAFGKSYAGDPDYKELQRKFANVDQTNGSAARAHAAPKLKVLKVKKKTKKIR